jgi:hypothetical protein
MQTWTEFISAVVGGSIVGLGVLPAAVWVLQLWMNRKFEFEFNKRLEEYKLGLDKQLENHKALLANITGKRVAVVIKTYRALVRAALALRRYLDPIQYSTLDEEKDGQNHAKRAEAAISKCECFNSLVFENRPLFDEALYDRLTEMAGLLTKIWNRSQVGKMLKKADVEMQAFEMIKAKVGPLQDAINDYARALLKLPGLS